MIAYLLKYISIETLPMYLVILAFICYLFSLKIVRHRNAKRKNLQCMEKDFILFQKYLDKYYIHNIYGTLAKLLVYFILLFGIFILFRILLLGTEYILLPQNTSYDNIKILLKLVLSFILFIIFYKTFLNILFQEDFIKLHIYLTQFEKYNSFQEIIFLCALRDYVYNLTSIMEYLSEESVEEDLDYYKSYDIMQNPKVWERVSKWRTLIFKFTFLRRIIGLSNKLLVNFSMLLYRCFKSIQTILILISCIECINGRLYYSYYSILVLMCINIIYQYNLFLRKKRGIDDCILTYYFYRNKIPYLYIRTNLFSNNNIHDPSIYETLQTKSLLSMFSVSINNNGREYMLNEFIQEDYTSNNLEKKNKIDREQIIIILFFITFYGTTLSLILYILLSIMFITSYKILNAALKEYKKLKNIYMILYWIALLLCIICIYILILQPKFTFMDSEILWNYGITITKIYSLEEKTIYFWNYCEYVMKNIVLPEHSEYMKMLVEKLNIAHEITETITLKEIKELVDNLGRYYIFRNHLEATMIMEILMEQYHNECRKILDEEHYNSGYFKMLQFTTMLFSTKIILNTGEFFVQYNDYTFSKKIFLIFFDALSRQFKSTAEITYYILMFLHNKK